MSDVNFELWTDEAEYQDVMPFLHAECVSVADPIPLQTRSLDGAQATTIIVAISGAAAAIASAFKAYFKNTGKTFTASTLRGKIHAKNFTAEEIRRLIGEADLLLPAKPEVKKIRSKRKKG